MVRCIALVSAAALLFAASAAKADTLIYGGTSGSLAAQAVFDYSGNQLTVTLTNTSLVAVQSNPDVLAAVFFDFVPALSSFSATVLAGDAITIGKGVPSTVTPGPVDVTSWWRYFDAATPVSEGITSVGFGINATPGFGPNIGGADYGIIPDAGIASGAGGTPLGSNPYIKNSVQFKLTVATTGTLAGNLSNVRFQYGTSLTDSDDVEIPGTVVPGSPVVPEPSTLVILATICGAASCAGYRRRKRLA